MFKATTEERMDRRKAVEMFQRLPKEERIRVEGIIVGLTLAREQSRTPTGERREGA